MVIHVHFAFQSFISLQHAEAWQSSMGHCLDKWENEHGKPFLFNLHVFIFSRLQYFFLFSLFILFLSPLFCNCTFCCCCFLIDTPPYFLLLHMLHLLLWLLQSFFFLFLIIIIPAITILPLGWVFHCMSMFSFFLLFSFLPKLLPFHSIGTREVVTQKNLCGLVPIRDFRLDPGLLYSIPLLALSPNLLIVWLFLSIAYLVARLRCKWRWNAKMQTSARICIVTWYLFCQKYMS